MRGWVLLLALVGAALAAASGFPERIVGGEEASILEYPYLSNMEYRFWDMWWLQWCGGSLITTSTVLSAAHCYSDSNVAEWRIRLGSSYPTSGGSIHVITRIVSHPQFSKDTFDYDVAIIRLRDRVMLTDAIKLASIAGPAYSLNDGDSVRAVGWGTIFHEGPYPVVLQSAEVQIINFNLCVERYSELREQIGTNGYPEVTSRMVCSGILDVGGKDACEGDYGGPLVHRNSVVVGITSWGHGCADRRYPGVSTRLAAVSQWIVNSVIDNYRNDYSDIKL